MFRAAMCPSSGELILSMRHLVYVTLCRWPSGMQVEFWLADDVNILGDSVHTVKENTEALVVVSKETGLDVNADKTTYMVMSRDQNAGPNHSIKIDNSSF